MAKYLIEASYTHEGIQGLVREGGSRRSETVARIVEGLGGVLEAFYYAFGTTDAYIIVDLPTPSNAVAFSLALNKTGAMGVKTHVLVTPQEVDDAADGPTRAYPPQRMPEAQPTTA